MTGRVRPGSSPEPAQRSPRRENPPLESGPALCKKTGIMKILSLVVLFAVTASFVSSCTPARRAGGYRPYGIYSSSVYEDASGYWDVYRSRSSTRVKYTN